MREINALTNIVDLSFAIRHRKAQADLKDASRRRFFGLTASLVVHLLLITLIFSGTVSSVRHHTASHGAMQVSFVVASEDNPAKQAQDKQQAEPTPTIKTEKADQLTVKKIVQPLSSADAQKSAKTEKADAKDKSSEPDSDVENSALLQGWRNNWLQPPSTPRLFRCHVKVNYLAGGIISSVEVLTGCGSAALNDSIERAVWKTQPLPISASRTQAGSLTIDFTP